MILMRDCATVVSSNVRAGGNDPVLGGGVTLRCATVIERMLSGGTRTGGQSEQHLCLIAASLTNIPPLLPSAPGAQTS